MELLVITAMAAILTAVLLPTLTSVREAARRATCLSNLHQLAVAHRLYIQDYDEMLPAWYVTEMGRITAWPSLFSPYIRSAAVLRQGFTPPAGLSDTPCQADYALLSWGPGGLGTPSDPYFRWPGSAWPPGQPLQELRLAQVCRSADTILLADGFTWGDETMVDTQHENRVLNVAMVDGHVQSVTASQCRQVDRDQLGYFYHYGAADR